MTVSNPTEIMGNTRSSEAEKREHHANLYAKRTTDVPTDMQIRIEYNGDGTQKYVGYGAKGLAVSDPGWLIYEFTYNASLQMTLRQSAYDQWDNRATASYA